MTKNQNGSSVTETAAVAGEASPATRDRILDAADRLLARFGYRKMTVDDIAQEAGIGKGTVYLSFPSKEEVALCCLDRMVARLLERLRAIATEPRPLDERLRDMMVVRVLHRFDYAQTHVASLDAMLPGIRPGLLSRRAGYFASEAAIFAAMLDNGGATDGPSPSARDAEALVAATNSLLPYSLSTRELGDRADLERRVLDVSSLIIRALCVTPGRRSARASSPRRSR